MNDVDGGGAVTPEEKLLAVLRPHLEAMTDAEIAEAMRRTDDLLAMLRARREVIRLPWRVRDEDETEAGNVVEIEDGIGDIVAEFIEQSGGDPTPETLARADLIVRAVNAHSALVATLRDALPVIQHSETCACEADGHEDDACRLVKARRALAAAEGQR